jgi:hypothetical protein
MKLKSLRKLALSGVALAAAATTLGTSTFAWYVTNSTATASGVQGAANAGGAGNVLVAQATSATGSLAVNGHGAFKQNITMESSNFGLDGSNTAATTTAGLNPATPGTAALATDADDPSDYANAITSSSQLASAVWVDKDGVEQASGNYIKFDIWLLSTSKTSITLSYSISNTTAGTDVKKQLAYANDGLPTGVSQSNTFAVNIVDALRMAIVPTGATLASAVSTGLFDVAGSASANTATYGSFVTGGSANDYLTAVLGEECVRDGVDGVSQSAIGLTVAANEEAKLTFYVWLEGTDGQCFDSCGNQTFKIDFSFAGN